MSGVRSRNALAVHDIHPAAVGAESDVVWLVRRRDQACSAIGMLAEEWNDGDRIGAGVDGVERAPIAGQRDCEGAGTCAAGLMKHAGRRARVYLGNDLVSVRIDDRNLVGVVLRDEQHRLRGVECQPQRVSVELDALHETRTGRRRNIDRIHFPIAVGRHISDAIILDRHGERERPACAAADAFVARRERAQIVFVADRARRGIDDADRIVVVVRYDERLAVAGNGESAGVGLNVDAEPDAVVTERNRARQRPCAAAVRIGVHGIVFAAGRIERGAVGGKDEADERVGLLDDLGEFRMALVGAADVIQEDVLRRIGGIDLAVGTI